MFAWQHYLTAGAPDHNIRGGLFTLGGDGTLALDGDVFDVNTTTASDQGTGPVSSTRATRASASRPSASAS